MKIKLKNFCIDIEEALILIVFICLFFVKVKEYFENYFVCYLFIAFHELSHIFIANIFGIKINRLNIRISGLCVSLNDISKTGIRWMIIYFAGPISNIILALLFKNIEIVYTINLVLAIVNLLPIYPLDGYNILRILLNIMKIKNVDKLQNIIQSIFGVLFGILGMYQLLFFSNPSIILMTFYIFIQGLYTSKKGKQGLYQKCYKNVTKFASNY